MCKEAKYDRTCYACGVEFKTHKPKAKRCDTCIKNGVAAKAQPPGHQEKPKGSPKAKPKPEPVEYDRKCFGCGDQFTSRRSDAVRCPACVEANVRTQKAQCPACDNHAFKPEMIRGMCPSCAEAHEGQIVLSFDDGPTDEELRQMRIEKRRKKLSKVQAIIDQFSKPPKKAKLMTTRTQSIPVNVLWKELCLTDGSATVLLNAADNLTDDEKERLSLIYLRLRLKGHRPQQLDRLDAAHLMGFTAAQINEMIAELAEVEDDPQEFELDPLEGLDPDHRAEVEAFMEIKQRNEDAARLGIAI